MKQIKAFIHHVRTGAVVDALRDAGYKNITLLDVKGALKPLSESEQDYSSAAGVVVSEMRVSLVCDDSEVDKVTALIRNVGHIGSNVSGWVYVSPIDQVLPIDGSDD